MSNSGRIRDFHIFPTQIWSKAPPMLILLMDDPVVKRWAKDATGSLKLSVYDPQTLLKREDMRHSSPTCPEDCNYSESYEMLLHVKWRKAVMGVESGVTGHMLERVKRLVRSSDWKTAHTERIVITKIMATTLGYSIMQIMQFDQVDQVDSLQSWRANFTHFVCNRIQVSNQPTFIITTLDTIWKIYYNLNFYQII